MIFFWFFGRKKKKEKVSEGDTFIDKSFGDNVLKAIKVSTDGNIIRLKFLIAKGREIPFNDQLPFEVHRDLLFTKFVKQTI